MVAAKIPWLKYLSVCPRKRTAVRSVYVLSLLPKALSRSNVADDQTKSGRDLNQDRGRGSLAEESTGVGHTKLINEGLVTCNVATVCTERLCEGTHEDVDFSRVDTKVVADTSALHTESTNLVSLVDEQVELVLSLESDDFGEVAHGAFH